jgi:hypothetical protein
MLYAVVVNNKVVCSISDPKQGIAIISACDKAHMDVQMRDASRPTFDMLLVNVHEQDAFEWPVS